VRYFDLDGAKSLAYIAGDIVAQLRPPITLRARDLAHSTDRAWASSTARQVYEALRHAEPPLTRWLVFDHFDRARSDDAIVFFAVLAEQVALAASDPNVTHGPRLVLIDHGVPLPDVARPVAAEVVVSRVTVPDLEQFGRRCRSTWTAADARRLFEDVRAAADAAIDDLQRAAPGVSVADPFMDMLCKRLHALLCPEPTPGPTPEPTR
jgi:hypothetical protein